MADKTKQYAVTISGNELDVELVVKSLRDKIKKYLQVLDLKEFSMEEVKKPTKNHEQLEKKV